tara:strand:- start:14060 stop:14476 length:417 start_codon:yes stop_codon:yes gene_type:complete
MPALEKDTKLVMTILFVGAICGVNVFFYAEFGHLLAFNHYSHAVVFALMTIGGILVMKAIFDLILNDYIEMALLDRRISAYWHKRGKDEQQRERVRQSLQQHNQTWGNLTPQQNFAVNQPIVVENTEAKPSFLAQIEQ